MYSPPDLKQQKYGLLKQQKHGLLHQHILYNLLSGIQAMCSGCEALVISHERICACVIDVYDMACCTLHCHDDLFFCIVCYSTASSFTRDKHKCHIVTTASNGQLQNLPAHVPVARTCPRSSCRTGSSAIWQYVHQNATRRAGLQASFGLS